MKYECNVIRDLLPMYKDGVLSAESNKAIQEHLQECPKCREYHKNCTKDIRITDDTSVSEAEIKDTEYLIKYKKKFKSFVTKLILVITALVLLVGLIFVGVIAKLTVFADSYKTTDIEEYRDFNGHIESEAQELYGSRSRLLIFPQDILPTFTVNQFYYKCASSGFDNSYQMILDYTLPQTEFENEVQRLAQLKMEYAGETKHIYNYTTSFNYPAYVSLFSKFNDYEYALVDEQNCRIVCVLSCNTNINKLPIDSALLPITDELYLDAEGWYGYSMYHFEYTDGGGLIIPSPPTN